MWRKAISNCPSMLSEVGKYKHPKKLVKRETEVGLRRCLMSSYLDPKKPCEVWVSCRSAFLCYNGTGFRNAGLPKRAR